ncbi:MAG: hypothetical protein P4L40_15520 [Terracidiphilus sp.]|nr:hypothetical protein [Terracidiphilus sp.]
MLPHRSFVGVLACLGALFAFPPLLRLTLQARPATHTVEVQYWALHPASRDSRQLKVAFLTFVGPCVPERAFLRWLAKEDGLAPDLTLGGLDMLSCHEGNEAHGDARALHHASVSTSGMGAFSCAAVPTEKWLGWHDAFRQDCVYLKDVDINLFNVRVQLSLFDDFQGGSPITWGPVTDPRYRNIMELPERQGVPVLEPAPAPCDDRTPALHANLCLRGSKPSFVAASAKFSEAWIPETIVLQFQVRMLHCFRPGKEGGPIGARIMQALSSDPAVMPASIELSVDWNRINTNTELPTGACWASWV